MRISNISRSKPCTKRGPVNEPVERVSERGQTGPQRDAEQNVVQMTPPHAVVVGLTFRGRCISGHLAGGLCTEPAIKHSADQRRNPEQSQLCESPIANKKRGTRAARRVDRSVGDGNADEVDEREREADRDRSEARGCSVMGRAHDDEKEHHR